MSLPMDDALIRVENLAHTYAHKDKGEKGTAALKGVTFAVGKGEIFGLLGPNGGGKTTLFRILSTALYPTGGSATVSGYCVTQQPRQVRRQIGVVFQSPSLDKKLTVSENLIHHGHLYGLCGRLLQERVREMLSRVRMTDRSRDLVETLSGGLQRRVELAKGLLHKPDVLLLDEPSTGLDPGARRDLWAYLKELQENDGVTSLVTTHLMEEAERCDRLGLLHQGELVALGTPGELKRRIGGDIISVESSDPHVLCEQVTKRFGGNPVVVGRTLRIEREAGHQFIPQLAEAFAGQITSITLGKPTLEDVFIQMTGHRFWSEESEGNANG